MVNNQMGFTPISVTNGTDPCQEGRKSIRILMDFSLGQQYTLDLSQIQSAGMISSAQTLYIDNYDNPDPIIISAGVTLQRIIIPAGAQAYIPILQPNPPIFLISTVTPVVIPAQILNFFLPPYVWNGAGINSALIVSDPILDATVVNGRVQTTTQPLDIPVMVDGTGTITAGGTAQLLFAANTSRKRFLVQNPSTASEILLLRFGSNTAGPIELPIGTTWDESNFTVFSGDVYIQAATTGHAFTAYEG